MYDKMRRDRRPHPNVTILPNALANLAGAHYQCGDYSLAVQCAEEAISYIGASVDTLFMRRDLRDLATGIIDKCRGAQQEDHLRLGLESTEVK